MDKVKFKYKNGNIEFNGLENIENHKLEQIFKFLAAQFLSIIKYNLPNKSYEEIFKEIKKMIIPAYQKYLKGEIELFTYMPEIEYDIIIQDEEVIFKPLKEKTELLDYGIIIEKLRNLYKEKFNKELDNNELINISKDMLKIIEK